MSQVNQISFEATKSSGAVSGLLINPGDARFMLVFAHGAGAGMRHRFMELMSLELAGHGIATLRYQFPYMEAGSKRPDPKPILLATVRSAIAAAGRLVPGLQLLAGGKSMGGRMTSMACAEPRIEGVQGLVFFGFPLHPAGKPSTERAEHLSHVNIPMLFLQGTRDALADLTLLKPVCKKIRSTLHIVENADHSFHLPKKSGKSDNEVLKDLAKVVREWAERL